MTHRLAHRGPDGSGFYMDEHIALGHRRLSIIDLDGGQQPISNEDGSLVLICNGEIYNSPDLRTMLERRKHVFKTSTDVEVILHLYEEYGKDCVRMLRGMFAFALWDVRQRSLFLARDHLGQKPLFYYRRGADLVFASEIKALLGPGGMEPRLDLEGLWHYLSLRLIPERGTLFQGVRKLPAASTLTFIDGELGVENYWRPDFRHPSRARERRLVEELEALLHETVRLHMLSDVPVGAFLSGGVDSSLVAAIAASRSGAGFPVFALGVAEAGFNEVPFARSVADRYQMHLRKVTARPGIVELLPEMIFHMDEPADPYGAGIYQVSELAGRCVKVALSGDGGDESFAGYDRYLGQRLVDVYRSLPSGLRKAALEPLMRRIPETYAYKSLAQKAAWLQQMAAHTEADRYLESLCFLRFSHESKQELFTGETLEMITGARSGKEVVTEFASPYATDTLDRMLLADLVIRVPNLNLQIGDRMSMAHSLEVRCPFMDHVLVEFAATIPARLKLKRLQLKYMLRKVGRKYLPGNITRRSKQGFGFPLGHWMRSGQFSRFLGVVLDHSMLVTDGVFSAEAICRLLDEHRSGRADHNYRLWMLVNVELWYRLNFAGSTVQDLKALARQSVSP